MASKKTTVRKVLEGFRDTGDGARTVIDGEEALRVRLMGRVVEKFVNPERSYGSIVLDDETETITVKFFSAGMHKLADVQLGDLVEVLGRAGTFRDEVHLVADELAVFQDINWELLRKLELVVPDDSREKALLKAVREGKKTLEELQGEFGDGAAETLGRLLDKGEVYEASPGKYEPVA